MTVRKDSDAVAASKGAAYLAKQVSIAIERLTEHMKSASQHKPNENDVAYVIGGLEKVKTALESASSPTKTLKQVEELRMNGSSEYVMGYNSAINHALAILTTSTDETDGKGGTGA